MNDNKTVNKYNMKSGMLTLAIFAMQMLLQELMVKIPSITSNNTIFSIAIILNGYIGFVIIVILNKDLLKRDFGKFKEHKLRNFILSVILVIFMHMVIALTRNVITQFSAAQELNAMELPLFLSIPLAMIALTAPFTEELVFRYHLFYRFNNKATRAVMFVVSSILFGLIHYNAFGSNFLLMTPYMLMGAIFNGIYIFSDNIWNSIATHFLFNSINVVLGIFGMIMTKFIL